MARYSMAALILLALTPDTPRAADRAVLRTLRVDGRDRAYLVFPPEPPKKGMPVVFIFHGGGGNARQMERYTRFDDIAEKGDFIAVYPESVEGNWNDGRDLPFIPAQRDKVDDVAFVRALVDRLSRDHAIDRTRVFATGMSNGGIFSHYLAVKASGLVAGIAPVIGGMTPGIARSFHPEHPVSILIIQGTEDPLIPYMGGPIGFAKSRPRGRVIATSETFALYVKRNGNPGEPKVATIDRDPHDETSVETRAYVEGPGGVKTRLYVVKRGGHTWPGRPLYLPEALIGRASQEFDASDVIWSFFASCPPRKDGR